MPIYKCVKYDEQMKECKENKMFDFELATRSVGPWWKSLINLTSGVKVIPKRPCSSGGGGGGGCNMGEGNIAFGMFFFIIVVFMFFKQRYRNNAGKES